MKIKGCKKIFKFTYIQNIKSKAFIRSTVVIVIITMLMTLGINFIPNFFMDDNSTVSGESQNNNENLYKVKKAYIIDESGISPAPDFNSFNQLGVEIELIGADELDSYIGKIYNSSSAEILIHITKSASGNFFDILASRPVSTALINSDECRQITAIVSNIVSSANLMSIGVAPENLIAANSGISTHVTVAGEEPKSNIAIMINSFVPILSSLILFIFIFAYSQLVAQAIATEKTSRVMELLLTSVRPLAVIIGKVLAMGLVSLTQLAILVSTTTLTTVISAPFGMLGKILGSVQVSDIEMQSISTELASAFSNFNVMTVIYLIVIFILGFLFYSLIAGLIGASVSRAEDLQAAMQPLSLIAVFGFYLAYMPSIFAVEGLGDGEKNIFSLLAIYLPFSSPFALPSAVILGEIDVFQTLIALFVLALFDVLMVMLVAKVYENIILHTGDRIKFGAILKMAKRSKN